MYLPITIVGVSLGPACAGLVNRRFGLRDRRLLLAPVCAVYAVVLITADTRDLAPQAVQGFAVGTLITALIDFLSALWRRRGATGALRPHADESA